MRSSAQASAGPSSAAAQQRSAAMQRVAGGRPQWATPRRSAAAGASAPPARGSTRAQAASPGSVRNMSNQMRDMRSQMEEDEQLRVLMNSLRGSNLSDADFADAGVQMRLVDVSGASDGDSLPLMYDPDTIADYWERRPVSVFTRIIQLLSISSGFLSSFAVDYFKGDLSKNEVKRAIELRNIMTSLGPAYIKIGQALSIRPDLLSPAAMNELQALCDKVPSYDSAVAMELLSTELERPWQEVYSELTPEPIAAASLGQVYKGRLRDSGDVVAVKVQRPGVLETVTVDLFIIRRLGLFMRRFPQLSQRADIVALLDEWAARFFEELDYVREGQNATKFAALIADDLPQVVVPTTYSDFTTRRVLTTQWLDGEKLSQSQADDVGKLVQVGVICYLKQLLDLGFFHADPHPGNLIRTPDGRLAVLDFGLMTTIDDNIKYGMIEAISHLIHRDYEAIVEDFVTLDFIPPGTDLKPILPVLAKVFDQALAGGGAKGINFQDLAADLAQITFDYPFRIPPYFALIIRAIGVLEGIALVGSPDFAIVDEAFPYIAKRLMTDDSPRLRAALRYMVYGRDTVFDADRLIDLLDAFETFTEHSRSARGDLDLDQDPIQQAAAQRLASSQAAAALGRTSTFPDDSSGQASTSGRQLPTGFPSLPGFPTGFPTLPGLPGGGAGAGALAAAFGLGGGGGGGGTSLVPTSSLGLAGASVDFEDSHTREALRFVLSPEGAVFREFLLDELVKSIDALSRDQLRVLLGALGLQNASLPVLIPGANRLFLQLAPPLSSDDRRVVDNVAKLANFLTGGTARSAMGGSGGSSARAFAELAPLLPEVATSVVPELSRRLASRITARLLRELFV
ncbi:putative aarF domain-containing kinase chloroplastic [Micractinium conductrix]|uniref:AarF domain-containing kinase chloroplastic n=1 Tax=Micractinium conductrix TaxID=554055 RepID=A0A2P6VJS4_9CHLO|nr:putative aarF domain-containing kinase chloroplastic [Micractinium conductrix]|eukprot:PSC74356.1 putative aarF domain-containing kinase chloroplastic [Micractinium conductrix]